MTIVSEKQAYLMGFVFGCNGSVCMHKLHPEELNAELETIDYELYKVPDHKILEGIRKVDFLRGVFDRQGFVANGDNVMLPRDCITGQHLNCIDSSFTTDKLNYIWTDVNAVELLATLYYTGVTFYKPDNMIYFHNISCPNIWGNMKLMPSFKWAKGHPEAVSPSKNRFSDSGYDLTVVSKLKEKNGVHYYDTGIKVQPENGYYFEIVGRSSISKTGWMLANNVGIIDASYRGNIIIALVRVHPEAEEITLPMRLVQLIPRELILMKSIEVTPDELSVTTRGEGGFGSSGK